MIQSPAWGGQRTDKPGLGCRTSLDSPHWSFCTFVQYTVPRSRVKDSLRNPLVFIPWSFPDVVLGCSSQAPSTPFPRIRSGVRCSYNRIPAGRIETPVANPRSQHDPDPRSPDRTEQLSPARRSANRNMNHLTPDELQDLLGGCAVCASALEETWQVNSQALDHGMEGGKLIARFTESADAVKEGLALFARVRARVEQESSPQDAADHLQLLDAVARRASKVHAHYESVLGWMNVPPPRWDDTSVPRQVDAHAPEGYETIDDVLRGESHRRRLRGNTRPILSSSTTNASSCTSAIARGSHARRG